MNVKAAPLNARTIIDTWENIAVIHKHGDALINVHYTEVTIGEPHGIDNVRVSIWSNGCGTLAAITANDDLIGVVRPDDMIDEADMDAGDEEEMYEIAYSDWIGTLIDLVR